MIGADVGAVRQLAAGCGRAAAQMDALAGSLRQRLYSAGWDGDDAQAFRRDWEGRHAPVLTAVAAALREAGRLLLSEAQQQVDASSVRGVAAAAPMVSVLAAAPGRAGGLPIDGLLSLATVLASITDPEARLSATAAWERAWTLQRGVDGSGRFGVVPWEYSATAALEARVHADAGVELSSDGLTAEVALGAAIAATLTASGRIGNDHVNAHGSAHVSAEASAEATATAHLGPDGGSVRGGVSVGARAEAGVDGGVKVSGVDVGGRGAVYAGVDFHAQAEASFTADRVKAQVDVGAALGFGGGVSVDVDVAPHEIVQDVGREAEKLWNGLW